MILILAPMEGVTDAVFRQVVARATRPDLFFTEFTNVNSFASMKGRENALERFKIVETDPPIIAQIWGSVPEYFSETAGALSKLGFVGVDINMGCPDRHVVANGGGSGMIKTPELAVECIRATKKATDLPVSVKTRLSYSNKEGLQYNQWLPLLLNEHLSMLSVHLRTKTEMSKVPAHYELIPEILKMRDEIAPETKIIVNGDIKNRREAEKLEEKYPGIDGVMIGRGAISNPFCFRYSLPTQKELYELLLYHLDVFERDSRRPFETMRHFFKSYVKDFPGAGEIRNQMMVAEDAEAVRRIVKNAIMDL